MKKSPEDLPDKTEHACLLNLVRLRDQLDVPRIETVHAMTIVHRFYGTPGAGIAQMESRGFLKRVGVANTFVEIYDEDFPAKDTNLRGRLAVKPFSDGEIDNAAIAIRAGVEDLRPAHFARGASPGESEAVSAPRTGQGGHTRNGARGEKSRVLMKTHELAEERFGEVRLPVELSNRICAAISESAYSQRYNLRNTKKFQADTGESGHLDFWRVTPKGVADLEAFPTESALTEERIDEIIAEYRKELVSSSPQVTPVPTPRPKPTAEDVASADYFENEIAEIDKEYQEKEAALKAYILEKEAELKAYVAQKEAELATIRAEREHYVRAARALRGGPD